MPYPFQLICINLRIFFDHESCLPPKVLSKPFSLFGNKPPCRLIDLLNQIIEIHPPLQIGNAFSVANGISAETLFSMPESNRF